MKKRLTIVTSANMTVRSAIAARVAAQFADQNITGNREPIIIILRDGFKCGDKQYLSDKDAYRVGYPSRANNVFMNGEINLIEGDYIIGVAKAFRAPEELMNLLSDSYYRFKIEKRAEAVINKRVIVSKKPYYHQALHEIGDFIYEMLEEKKRNVNGTVKELVLIEEQKNEPAYV